MNKVELKRILEDLEISEYEYNIGDKPVRELELGILQEKGVWKVYQSLERGGMNIIEVFDNENDACELVLKYLKMRKKRQDKKAGI